MTACAVLAIGGWVLCSSGRAAVSENFDAYATGSQMHGQGGWKGWDNVPGAGALVSSAQAVSAPNSVAIAGGSDLVHQYSGMDSGRWLYSAKQYVPSTSSGSSYFILMNSYNDGGPYSWAVQTYFNMANSTVVAEAGVGSLGLIKDRWVPLLFDINLAANSVTEYYNGQMLSTHPWQASGPVIGLRAVDLYANGAGPVYYDDIAITQIPEPGQVAMMAMTVLGALGYAGRNWLRRK